MRNICRWIQHYKEAPCNPDNFSWLDLEHNILNYNSSLYSHLHLLLGLFWRVFTKLHNRRLGDKGTEKQPISPVCTQLLFQSCLQSMCGIDNKYGQKNMVPYHSGSHFMLHLLQVSVNIVFCDYCCKTYSIFLPDFPKTYCLGTFWFTSLPCVVDYTGNRRWKNPSTTQVWMLIKNTPFYKKLFRSLFLWEWIS